MSFSNLSQQLLNLKKQNEDKTIKKALRKQTQDIQKIQPIQNQLFQTASENTKQLLIFKQKLGFLQGDQKNNENTIKKSLRKQIKKFPLNLIEQFQANYPNQIQFTSDNDFYDSQIGIKFIKLDWSIQIFNELNVNSYLSQNFKSNQEQIFEKLQEKGYYLLNKLNLNQNQEIFEGYQQIEQTKTIGVCTQYYFAVIHGFSEEDFSQKIERASSISLNGLPLLIDYFNITQNTKIIVLQKYYYQDLDYQVIDYLIKDFKLWNYQLFNFINQGLKNHFVTDDEYNIFKSFKLHEKSIINALLQKNYYLTRYINKGGQGIIFDGFREDNSRVFNNFILKIYLDIEQSVIEEEIKIMQLFEYNGNAISLIDHIRLDDSNTSILVLEKCQFSLQDELQIFLKEKKFSFEKLMKMIFDLLDGLIQFRIYKILHLDIKPSNILISLSGNYIYTDFGLSKVKNQNQSVKVEGFTKQYASPEQKQQDISIDFRSDTYSLGKTFQQIINVYKIINQQKNYFIEIFEKIVNKKMVQEKCEQREDCKKIHQSLILKLITFDKREFLQGYLKKIEIIQDLYLYDESKDVTYFLKLNRYFHQVHLRILHKNYIKNIDKDSQYKYNQIKSIATQLNKIGLCNQNLSKFEKAIKYLLKSLEMKQIIFQGNHPEIASSLNDIGYCYFLMGNYQESLKFLLECLQMRRFLYISNNQDLAITLNHLGSAYEKIGQMQISLKYQLESLLMIRSQFKGDHKDIPSSLNGCGNSYINLYNYQKAFIKYDQSLKMNTNLFKQNHPNIAINNSSFGLYYCKLQDYENSLKHYQQCLEICQNIFGNQHGMVAQTLYDIGTVYYQLFYYDKALKNFEESYQIASKVYNYKNTFLTKCMFQIYLIYYEIKDQAKREKQGEKVIGQIKYQIQINNNDYELFDILGLLYSLQGNYQMSLKYCIESLKIKQQIFQKDHIEIARSLKLLGQIYEQLSLYKQSLKYSLESLLIYKKLMKNNDCEIIQFYTQVGGAYKYLEKESESLKYYLRAAQIARKQFKKNGNLLAYVFHEIGNYYKYIGQKKKALLYYLDSLEEKKQFYKESNIKIAQTLLQVGKFYYDQRDFKNSLKYFLEYIDMKQQLNYILYDYDYCFYLINIIEYYIYEQCPIKEQEILDKIFDSLNLLTVYYLKSLKHDEENSDRDKMEKLASMFEYSNKVDLIIKYYENLNNLDDKI